MENLLHRIDGYVGLLLYRYGSDDVRNDAEIHADLDEFRKSIAVLASKDARIAELKAEVEGLKCARNRIAHEVRSDIGPKLQAALDRTRELESENERLRDVLDEYDRFWGDVITNNDCWRGKSCPQLTQEQVEWQVSLQDKSNAARALVDRAMEPPRNH